MTKFEAVANQFEQAVKRMDEEKIFTELPSVSKRMTQLLGALKDKKS